MRKTLVVTAVAGVLLALGAGIAAADTGSDKPTDVQVLDRVPAVPVQHPAVLQNTVLPPPYNAVNGLSG